MGHKTKRREVVRARHAEVIASRSELLSLHCPRHLLFLALLPACDKLSRQGIYDTNTRMGVPDKLNKVIKGSYEGTRYRLRTKEGLSEPYEFGCGLKQGCPSAPVQLNIYHANAMHDFTTQVQQGDGEYGIDCHVHKDIGQRLRRRLEKIEDHPVVRIFELMFADDSSLCERLSRRERIEKLLEGVLAEWSEEVHPGKYERLRAHLTEKIRVNSGGTQCSQEVRGSWAHG